MCLDISVELLAQVLNGQMIIAVQKDGPQKSLRSPCPIFKRFFQKVRDWHNQAPLIPQLDHHISQRDLLDLPELALNYGNFPKRSLEASAG
jgi:hypothetical protein